MKKIRGLTAQALMEFALVLPLILLIILVFIELGRIVYFYSALNNAVREGARYATVHPYTTNAQITSQIQQIVIGYAIDLPLNSSNIAISCDITQADGSCQNYVTVSAQMQIEPILAYFAKVMGNGSKFNIDAQSTMQMTPYGSQ